MKKGSKMTEEQKKRVGLGHKGIRVTENTKRKLSLKLKGKKKPPRTKEHAQKIGDANRGRKASEESRKKMSLFQKGKIPWNLGKKTGPRSNEIKKKISISNTGQIRESMRGSKNHRWRGGISSENVKLRGSPEYKFWRRECLRRDNFTCKKSGQYGGELRVHHINNFADFPELIFIIDNGITLSKKSHTDFHKIYGNKNNTREQLDKFLKS